MDRIKKLKIKKQDGTFSDYIPIGADAENIDTTDGESVETKLNKKPYYYNSVADMKADTKLKVGDMAITLGYYNANDGGNGEYRIVSGNYVDNGGSYHELNNNLFAELIIKDNVYLKQFGAIKTMQDISVILQIAINFCKEKYTLIVDDLYNLTETVTINNPFVIKGKLSNYDDWACCGFKCIGDKSFFILDEGSINSTFERIIFKGGKSYSEGYEGTAIILKSRSTSLAEKRTWKNCFNKCYFSRFGLAVDFYASGSLADWDFSSEILFLDCKFINNIVHCHFANKQSYNINFIATDLETWYGSIGCIYNTLSGVNFYGCSIILRDDFIKVERNDDLNPKAAYSGTINVNACRFEILTETETVFNLKLDGGTYPGVAGDNHFNLNVSDTEFLIHQSGHNATLLNSNLQHLQCNMNGITFCGNDQYRMKIKLNGSAGITEYSRIIINTTDEDRLIIDTPTGGSNYTPWLIINNCIKMSCGESVRGNNIYEYNDKIYLGYGKTAQPTTAFEVFVPWDYRKFKIQINGAFLANSGSITITNSDGSFTETFTKSTNVLADAYKEIYLPYKADGDTYTITRSNIWGNCYFEK